MILDSGTKKFVFEKFVHFKKIFRISSNINFPQLFPRFLQLFFSQLLDRRHDSGERSKIRESQHRIINPIHIETIKLSKFCIEINTSLDTSFLLSNRIHTDLQFHRKNNSPLSSGNRTPLRYQFRGESGR